MNLKSIGGGGGGTGQLAGKRLSPDGVNCDMANFGSRVKSCCTPAQTNAPSVSY